MKGTGGKAVHMAAGIMASRVRLPNHLQICPQCFEEEKQSTGEPYWHRIHQLAAVHYCPTHGCRLLPSKTPFRSRYNRHRLELPEMALTTSAHSRLRGRATSPRESKNKRVTRSAIARHIGIEGRLRRHGANLPRTKQAIETLTESRVNHARCRLLRAATNLAAKQEKPATWRLLRAGGIRPERPVVFEFARTAVGSKPN